MLQTQRLVERLHTIGSFAFAVGARDEQGEFLRGEGRGSVAHQCGDSGHMALSLELLCQLARQTLSSTRLRGIENGNAMRCLGLCRCKSRGGKHACQHSVQPGALLWREGSILRNV